jgi:hypothetical protein
MITTAAMTRTVYPTLNDFSFIGYLYRDLLIDYSLLEVKSEMDKKRKTGREAGPLKENYLLLSINASISATIGSSVLSPSITLRRFFSV